MSHDESALHVSLRMADDGVGIRFPPGLGLVPPRDVPRPHKVRAEWTQ